MLDTIKKKITLENIMCLFVCLCPILDSISFLYRNCFHTSFSPTTILRPIIPCMVFMILFFKEKNKKQKIIVAIIYAIYSIIHLLLFQRLHNESSYGTLTNEIQYIINYSFMIMNLYLFYTVIKEKDKIQKSVFISLTIYILSLFIAIATNTSSSTYLEGIGYKGYFESGNSLCTVLLLSLCILLGEVNLKKDWKKVILILFTGIYLIVFSGMRTGVYGFSLVIGIFILGKLFINIRDKINLTKKQIIAITFGVIVMVVLVFILGSKTLERRKLLKQNEMNNIDEQTGEQRYVTGDILNLYKQITNGTLPEKFMSEEEKNAIIKLCELAKETKLSNVNLRAQQFIYNIILVGEQKDLSLLLFGNGYKNQTGELVMEMETPAILCNFGLIGFILYFGPFLTIFLYGLFKIYQNRKNVKIDIIMYLTGCSLAIVLSSFSGYVYFNFSSMTMVILLNILLLDRNKKEPSLKEQREEKRAMKKIVFGITSLGIGGAERVLVDIVNKLQKKYDITIFTLYGKGAFEKELDKNIKVIKLYDNSYEEMSNLKKKIIPIHILICGKSIYKKYIEGKFDIEIAFLEGPITRIFSYGKANKKIAWIHNDIAKVFGNNFKANLKLKIDKKIYNKYDKIIFVSNDNKDSFNKLYKDTNLAEKEEVIYNYIEKSRIIEKSNLEIGQEYIDKDVLSIIIVARLVKQKAIDRLINVHKRLVDEGIIHNIYVIGDGSEKENLENQIKQLKVEDTFKLMGKRENPYPYIKRADYFALLSRFEGYGMVIDEAKILNKTIIITNTAAKEAVKGYSKKLILENTEDAIFEGLKQVLQKNVIFEENETEYDNEVLMEKIEKLFK